MPMICADCGDRLMPCPQTPVPHACKGTIHARTMHHDCTQTRRTT